MRVSLCVICGNESVYVERLLEAFAPAFDELSLVRAIGSKEADDTVMRADTWCQSNGKDFIFSDYKNGLGAEKWDHVDSFASARNQSFRQSTGEWLVWADCDDVVERPEQLRKELEEAEERTVMIRFPYDVRGTNKKLFRERAVRRTAFEDGRHWCNDVHENLLIRHGDHHVDRSAPVWVHFPNQVKPENRARNIRILERSASEAATQYFYLHQEFYCQGNRDKALKFGRIAVSFANLPPAFRYEAFLNLGRMANGAGDAVDDIMRALEVFPWCREAYAAMVLLNFERENARKALWWASRMMELPEPTESERPWTHEPKWYGWAGDDLMARALRLNDRNEEADAHQRSAQGFDIPKISLLHATRGRSSRAVNCRELWLTTATRPESIEHIFAVDADDKISVGMAKQFVSVVSEAKSCVAAWNLAAEKSQGDLLVQLSDDWVPALGWDEKLLDALKGRDLSKEEIVVAVSDGTRKDDLLCMAILSRARLKKQGELFFSGYESVFSDNEFSHRAWGDGVVVDLRSSLTFQHMHPAFGKAKMDETYAHNNTTERYKAGETLFKERNP
jgi:glycosyltransferase involved in cell wall biosynthesis